MPPLKQVCLLEYKQRQGCDAAVEHCCHQLLELCQNHRIHQGRDDEPNKGTSLSFFFFFDSNEFFSLSF